MITHKIKFNQNVRNLHNMACGDFFSTRSMSLRVVHVIVKLSAIESFVVYIAILCRPNRRCLSDYEIMVQVLKSDYFVSTRQKYLP